MDSRTNLPRLIVEFLAWFTIVLIFQVPAGAEESQRVRAVFHRLSIARDAPISVASETPCQTKATAAGDPNYYIQADSDRDNTVEVLFEFPAEDLELERPVEVVQVSFSIPPDSGSLNPTSARAELDPDYGVWWVTTKYNPCEDECTSVEVTAQATATPGLVSEPNILTVHLDERYHTGCGAEEYLVVETYEVGPHRRRIPVRALVKVTVDPSEAGSAIPSQGYSEHDPNTGRYLFPFTYYPSCGYSGRVRVKAASNMLSFDQNTETLTFSDSREWETVCEDFCSEGQAWNFCQVYKMDLRTDCTYDFSLRESDGVGAHCDADNGFLEMFDTSGSSLWMLIDPWDDASTIGSDYENWSPPSDGYYYLHASGMNLDPWLWLLGIVEIELVPMSYCLAYQQVCPCSIAVTSPSASDSWAVGKLHVIEWNSEYNPGDYVNIELYQGSSKIEDSGIDSPTDDDGSHSWPIPSDLPPGDYHIKITSTSESSCGGKSNNFSIERPLYRITASAGPNGSISPSGPIDKPGGEEQEFEANPGTNYDVDQWYLDDDPDPVQTGGNTYTLPNIQSNHTVRVTFRYALHIVSSEIWGGVDFNTPGAPSDFDADGDVDFADLGILASHWGQSDSGRLVDIAPHVLDGVVNILDLAIFAEDWCEESVAPGEMAYGFRLALGIDETAALVQFVTPAGSTFEIPKQAYTHSGCVKTWHYLLGGVHYWRYEAEFSSLNALGDYGDGTYRITVDYEDGGRDHTTVGLGRQLTARTTDLNGDGKSDLLWRQASTGYQAATLMDGLDTGDSGWLGGDGDWQIAAAPDFNGDGKSDLLWRQLSTGHQTATLMDGLTMGSNGWLGGDLDWQIVATPDFDGDCKSDLLWRQVSTGYHTATLMDGTTMGVTGWLGGDFDWSIVATPDFDGDGKSDLLWRQLSTGQQTATLMDGLAMGSSGWLGGSPDWQIVATPDFNGDGKSDLLWRQVSTGYQTATLMDGLTVGNSGWLGGSLDWQIVATPDFDGDGQADLLWHQLSTGDHSATIMDGLTMASSGRLGGDTNWQIVAAPDFNGDGKSDLLWRQVSTGDHTATIMDALTTGSSGWLGGDLDWQIVTSLD